MSYGKDLCIYCKTTKDLKSSSGAKAFRSFIVNGHSQQELLPTEISKTKLFRGRGY